MLRSIVRQFGNQEQSAYDLLSELFEKCREMTPSLSAEILRELLQKMMQKFGEAYIILDALMNVPKGMSFSTCWLRSRITSKTQSGRRHPVCESW